MYTWVCRAVNFERWIHSAQALIKSDQENTYASCVMAPLPFGSNNPGGYLGPFTFHKPELLIRFPASIQPAAAATRRSSTTLGAPLGFLACDEFALNRPREIRE